MPGGAISAAPGAVGGRQVNALIRKEFQAGRKGSQGLPRRLRMGATGIGGKAGEALQGF
jgi:hypothetical protein